MPRRRRTLDEAGRPLIWLLALSCPILAQPILAPEALLVQLRRQAREQPAEDRPMATQCSSGTGQQG